MRGSPFWQLVFVVAVFLLVGVPVYRLTRPAAAAATVSSAVEPAASAEPVTLGVAVEFSPPPTEFQVQNLGQTLLAGQGPHTGFIVHWTTTLPAEGVDLVLKARWSEPPGGGMVVRDSPAAAARLRVYFPDGRQVERSFWTTVDAPLAETFTIPGASGATTP